MTSLRIGACLVSAALLLPALAPAQTTQEQAVRSKVARVFGEALRGHPQGVRSAQFSPDGKRVLTSGEEGELRLWTASSGKLWKAIPAHEGSIYYASYYDGGTKIVSAGTDRTIAFFDAKKGTELGRIRDLPEEYGQYNEIIVGQPTPDGKFLLLKNMKRRADGLLRVDLGKHVMAEPLELPKGEVSTFALSPDGRYLAMVQWGQFLDTDLHLYDLSEKKTVVRKSAPRFNCLRFTADGSKLIAFGAKGWLVCNGKTGEEEAEFENLVDIPNRAALSKDGSRAFVGSMMNGRLVGVDLTKSSLVFEWPEFSATVTGVTLSPDEKTVVASSHDGSLRFFDARTGKEKKTSKGHQTRVTAASLSSDGTKIVTGSHDNEVILWDAARRREIARHREHELYIMQAGFNAKGQPFSLGQDLKLKFLDAESGAVIKTVDLESADENILGAIANASGTLLVSNHYERNEREVTGKHILWDLATGEIKGTFETEGVFDLVGLSNDGETMAILENDRLALRQVGAGETDFVFAEEDLGYYDLAILDNATLLTGDIDGALKLWKKGTVEAIKTVAVAKDSGPLNAILTSPDGKRVFAATDEGVVIFDRELTEVGRITAFDSPPASLGLSADGKSLLCGMSDSTLLVWSLDKVLK